MTSTWKGDGADLKICHMAVDSLVFKQKIYLSMTSKWFKITTNSIIRGSSFFFSIKPQSRYILSS